MFGKKKDTANVQKAVAAAASFEVTIGELARKSERRAWMVAFCSLLMSLALAGGYYFMLPLKEKVPYVVMADPFSGTASVAVMRDDPFYQSLVADETLARANIANYVVARESFDTELLKARDWAQVNVMSSADERKVFANSISSDSPTTPAKLVRTDQSVRVRIASITPIYDAGRIAGATVRIQRNLVSRDTGAAAPIDRRLITLTFVYVPNLELDENLRWLNPLGFVVTNYRSDLDMSATEPGNVDSALREAVSSASNLLAERDEDIEALKAQARAVAAASSGMPALDADAGTIPPPPVVTLEGVSVPVFEPPAGQDESGATSPSSTPPPTTPEPEAAQSPNGVSKP